MYVRLKHTLSALTLEMLEQRPEQRPHAWLLAYARLSKAGEAVPFDLLQAESERLGPSNSRSLEVLEKHGLMVRTGGTVSLAPGYKPHFAYFVRQVERLGSALQLLEEQELEDQKRSEDHDRALRVAAALFDAGLFFECHEYLEGVWRKTHDESREFYHGIIQLAAAFYHYEKGNLHGARTLLAKGRRRLEPYAPRYRGLQVGRLLAEMDDWADLFSSDRGAVGSQKRKRKLPRLPFSTEVGRVKKS